MKNKILIGAALLGALCLAAAGCAQQDTLNSGEKARQYLELYIQRYYPYVTPNEYGLFVLEDTPGSGKAWHADSAYTYARTTIRSLGGSVASTTEELLAKQLGTFTTGHYYGPRFQQMGENQSYAGVDALFAGMRVGGTRKAIIPAWLLTTSRYKTAQEYIDACTNENTLEYTVTLEGQVQDIAKMEKDSLARYIRQVWGSVQPVSFTEDAPDGTFYFISDSSAFAGKPHFPADTNGVRLNYTGRLLNGQVFDTTLEKVAKDAGIYHSARTYSPATITPASNYSEVKMDESSSLINGFKAGVHLMHWVGQKAVVLFVSDHGYGTTGSGQAIPPYSPLIFELELL